LKEHNYFGYNPEKVHLFKQSKMPLMSKEGKILVDKDFQIKQASDGHGGIFNSMKNSRNNMNIRFTSIKTKNN
jgi:UDP-N-acetylglucosamine pyrophosphorylase